MTVSHHFSSPSRTRLVFATGMALAVVFAGCRGDDQKSNVPLIPVVGTVILDGRPLDEADVNFFPDGNTQGHGGYGRTGKDGMYKAATPFGEPGLAAGTYRVVIQKLITPDGKPFTGSVDPNVPPIEAPYTEVLPPIYSDDSMSTLNATVSPQNKRPVDFILKTDKKRR